MIFLLFRREQKEISTYDGTLDRNILGVELEHCQFVSLTFKVDVWDIHLRGSGGLLATSSIYPLTSLSISLLFVVCVRI